jgi:hypothetical protein
LVELLEVGVGGGHASFLVSSPVIGHLRASM